MYRSIYQCLACTMVKALAEGEERHIQVWSSLKLKVTLSVPDTDDRGR